MTYEEMEEWLEREVDPDDFDNFDDYEQAVLDAWQSTTPIEDHVDLVEAFSERQSEIDDEIEQEEIEADEEQARDDLDLLIEELREAPNEDIQERVFNEIENLFDEGNLSEEDLDEAFRNL